jgi:hypothetical protein
MGMFSPQQKLGSEYALGELKETVTRLENMLKGQADLLQEVKERLQRIEELLAHGTASPAPTAAPVTPAQPAAPIDPVELYNQGLGDEEKARDFRERYRVVEVQVAESTNQGALAGSDPARRPTLTNATTGSMYVAQTGSTLSVFPIFRLPWGYDQDLVEFFDIERQPMIESATSFVLKVCAPAEVRQSGAGWVLEAKGRIIVASR